MTDCPKHGKQRIIRTYASKGSDPYEIEVAACGCHLIWFDKDDVHIIKENSK